MFKFPKIKLNLDSIIVGFIIAMLITTFVLTTGIIKIKFVSAPPIESQRNFKIEITRETIETFNTLYDEKKENVYCLFGTRDGNIFTINSFQKPKQIVLQEKETIGFDLGSCDSTFGFVGTLHTHPKNICTASNTDWYFYGQEVVNRSLQLHGIQCNVNNFAFFYAPNITGEKFLPVETNKKMKMVFLNTA